MGTGVHTSLYASFIIHGYIHIKTSYTVAHVFKQMIGSRNRL